MRPVRRVLKITTPLGDEFLNDQLDLKTVYSFLRTWWVQVGEIDLKKMKAIPIKQNPCVEIAEISSVVWERLCSRAVFFENKGLKEAFIINPGGRSDFTKKT